MHVSTQPSKPSVSTSLSAQCKVHDQSIVTMGMRACPAVETNRGGVMQEHEETSEKQRICLEQALAASCSNLPEPASYRLKRHRSCAGGCGTTSDNVGVSLAPSVAAESLFTTCCHFTTTHTA